MTKFIATFDPGETTGYSIWRNQDLLEYGTIGRESVVGKFDLLNEAFHPKIVVIEQSFQRPWINPVNFRVTGMLEALARERDIKVVFQSPSLLRGPRKWPSTHEIKTIINNPHAQDAVFHGFLYLKASAWRVTRALLNQEVTDNVVH